MGRGGGGEREILYPECVYMECLDHFGLYEADTSPLYKGEFVVQCAIVFWNKPCAITR